MSENSFKLLWRCAKCSSHFVNIYKTEGMLKQEKKCTKCKSVNTLTVTDKEIFIHCRIFDSTINGYNSEFSDHYPYPP